MMNSKFYSHTAIQFKRSSLGTAKWQR